MKKWKTLQSNYLYQTPFGNLRKDMCELPDGQVIENYYVNEYSDWVNAIVLTEENNIVLVKQYRYAANDFFIEIPAGKREKGETYKEAILREIREETGFVSDEEPILLSECFVNPATQTNKVRTYLIRNAYQAFEQELDPIEFIDIKIMDIDTLGELIDRGEVTQFFTVSAYYMLENFRRKHK
ncbi:MAG TPA: NUDIX hydrolase [Cerasibacillus sp.]|uniref:NUDIX hydrolase n=1 Tax=Cerasibacillus sp. TaxID=2498711 RepID=UPI002F3E357A